jgi:hypothetical protein
MKYSVEDLKNDPATFFYTDDTLYAQWRDTTAEFTQAEIILVYPSGVAVVTSYHTDEEWRVGPSTVDGNGVYIIPWDQVHRIYTKKECEEMEAMRAADDRLLGYAR